MRHQYFAAVAIVAVGSALASHLFAAEVQKNPAERDPQALVNRIKLRQMTQQLNLTPEQQKKCQAYLDEQAVQISAVQKDTTLPLDQKLKKQDAIALEFKAKLKTTLNDEQRAKWDEGEAKAAAKKKRSAAARAPGTDADKEKDQAKPAAPAAPAPERKAGS